MSLFPARLFMVQIGISLLIFRQPADGNNRAMEILGIIVIIIAGLIVFYWEDITSRGLF